ncbi:thiol-disulfide oxidoreductase [Pradoshia eiseniae]|uniref:Thiol-disulfide oxidoreductase n=1 Tax=Pradoshia eiseniae TaxID=2064768 RepID=A0A2S7N3M6_9BACI|nr:DCC1-like thiol-disulfide oxidoreductase family protein [Pradoshia eiseniae]PQD96634.1 thiol-disulfide oxidoreductase [Pradoshia eiseniae]
MNQIILFDGVCQFCDKSVQFILKRDLNGKFSFCSLQSDTGFQLRKDYHIPEELDSIILIQGEKYHSKSTAALKIARELKGGWKWLYIFIVIPRPIRDAVYDRVARNRLKWFGEKTACELPTPEVRKRFLS